MEKGFIPSKKANEWKADWSFAPEMTVIKSMKEEWWIRGRSQLAHCNGQTWFSVPPIIGGSSGAMALNLHAVIRFNILSPNPW
ncbi:MAG: hypothetical protein MI755_15230 [Sphingomonadales bacterium]|nr:hypothetical protein [Sphingomonadales bacterium]